MIELLSRAFMRYAGDVVIGFFSYLLGSAIVPSLALWLTPDAQGAVGLPLEVQTLLSMGVGGAVSAIVLIWKRQDDKAYQKSLESIIARQEVGQDRLITIIQNSTTAMQSLQATVSQLANLKQITDLLEDVARRETKR